MVRSKSGTNASVDFRDFELASWLLSSSRSPLPNLCRAHDTLKTLPLTYTLLNCQANMASNTGSRQVLQAPEDPTQIRMESFKEKAWRKTKENPLVPISAITSFY